MSHFVGDTRWKKMKKLYLISKQIIVEYGLGYFIRVAILELKKQGFSMFLPDAKITPIYSEKLFEEKYQTFLKNMNNRLDTESGVPLNYNPKICLVIDATKNSDTIQQTLDSLDTQIYQNWFTKILVNEGNRLKNEHNITQFIDVSDSEFYDKLISDNSDSIGFINSGTILSSFALLEFVKKINDSERDILYCDHDHTDYSNKRHKPYFKPDWSPYILRSMNYLSPFFMIRTSLVQNLTFTLDTKDCMIFDILLQCSEKANNVAHISLPLASILDYQSNSFECKKTSLENHLKRINVDAKIKPGILGNTFQIDYSIQKTPKVSIIIPTANNYHLLKRCIASIEKKTHYKNWEIIIIDNSDGTLSAKQSNQLEKYYESISYLIIRYNDNFHFSKMNNLAVKSAQGDLLLFLNDDTKILDSEWLNELVSIVLQEDVGAVGPKLVYSDSTIQHGGMVFLKTGAGFHPSMKEPEDSSGYHNMLNITKECSAVTGACMLVKREIFEQVGGFDDSFDVYYGDSDLCLKIQNAGYRIIYTPFTKLLHEGSFSLQRSGASYFGVENHQAFIKKWPHLKKGDPFYNPNLGWNYDIDASVL